MRRTWKWLLPIVALLVAGAAVAILMLPRQPKDAAAQSTPWLAALPDVVTDGDISVAAQKVQGAKGQDLSKKDFTAVKADGLYDLTFDTQTRWPAASKLPSGFDPAKALEWAKDPGLGLRALHSEGIDGRGISVAVFDKPIRQTHQEFTGRIHYIEVFPDDPKNRSYHFHGAAAASILAGKTVGVAPGATLYYFAVPDNGQNISNYATAMEKLFEVNKTLPPAERIRVVSVSDGFGELNRPDVVRWADLIKQAEAQGIAVVHCGSTFPVRFDLTGAWPWRDRNNPDNYFGLGLGLMVPAHTRTTAGNESDSAYTYWGKGGASWAAPYLAGLAALGLQVNPEATPAQLYAAMTDTAKISSSQLHIVNPDGFVNRAKLKS